VGDLDQRRVEVEQVPVAAGIGLEHADELGHEPERGAQTRVVFHDVQVRFAAATRFPEGGEMAQPAAVFPRAQQRRAPGLRCALDAAEAAHRVRRPVARELGLHRGAPLEGRIEIDEDALDHCAPDASSWYSSSMFTPQTRALSVLPARMASTAILAEIIEWSWL